MRYDDTKIHPLDEHLRPGRIPHIWCPACGLGTILSAYIIALKESNIDMDKNVIISGIGCTGRAAGYLHVDIASLGLVPSAGVAGPEIAALDIEYFRTVRRIGGIRRPSFRVYQIYRSSGEVR